MSTDLPVQLVEQGGNPIYPDPVFKTPDRGPIGNIDGVLQTTESPEAATVQQLELGLFVG